MEISALLDRDKMVFTLRVIDGNIKYQNEHLNQRLTDNLGYSLTNGKEVTKFC